MGKTSLSVKGLRKIIAIVLAVIAFVIVCSVAAHYKNSKTIEPGNYATLSTITTPSDNTTINPDIPEQSNEFIKTALLFINEYKNGSSTYLENLAKDVIEQSSNYKHDLYYYLYYYVVENYGEDYTKNFGYNCETINSVKVSIHNYNSGSNVGTVSFNGYKPIYNYDHDKIILAAGVLSESFSDNVALAEAEIASYVLTQINQKDIDCCIITSGGTKSYDFTFENEAFSNAAIEILYSRLW